ncbi:MAG TPA: UDP-N-acetylmuramate--L-alanine ligase [candidate division Zixibacteria bacterium]
MKFKKVKQIHFVGIGGAGMCGLAEVLFNSGYQVTGSDISLGEVTEKLKSLGIKVFGGHSKENIEGADVVVISSAVKPSNVEVTYALEKSIPVIRRAEMLGELMRMKYGIAIAGTHGKTTTTSMVGQILTEGGLDPTIIVGGKVVNLDSSAKLGQGEYLVAEADEFDRSFLRLSPMIAVITTLEAEHLDCYQTLDQLKSAFVEFANKVPFYGRLILCLDEESLQNLIPKLKGPITTYGLMPQADMQAENIKLSENRSRFTVKYKGEELGNIELAVPGMHNAKNSLAAASVGLELDIPWEKITLALRQFRGVKRRFEIKGESKGIMIVDDYAHHPTEIEATLKAAKNGWNRRIVVVFQPHLYSRTKDFAEQFGKAFFNCDILVVTDIYAAREEPMPGVSGELVSQAAKRYGHKQVHYKPKSEEILPFLLDTLKPGDMLITMGAGDIYQKAEQLLNLLQK